MRLKEKFTKKIRINCALLLSHSFRCVITLCDQPS
jgi:hypothetical protein